MSYEILDARAFIRTSTGVIMLVLGGSNNCTQVNPLTGRENRECNWFVLYGSDFLNKPEDEILLTLKEKYDSCSQSSELFRWHSKWVTVKDGYQWVKRGIDNAHTLEDYYRYNPYRFLHCKVVSYEEAGEKSVWKEQMYDTIHSTEHLEEWLLEAEELRKKYKAKGMYCELSLQFDERKPMRMPLKNHDVDCVIKSKHGYLESFNETGTTWRRDPKNAMVFQSVEVAFATIEGNPEILKRIGHVCQKPTEKEKPYVLYVSGGPYNGQYVHQKTRSRTTLQGCLTVRLPIQPKTLPNESLKIFTM